MSDRSDQMRDSLLTVVQKKAGRPRVSSEPLLNVSMRLPTETYDRLIMIAERRETTVSALLRRAIILTLDKVS
jgi:hypothetical protein